MPRSKRALDSERSFRRFDVARDPHPLEVGGLEEDLLRARGDLRRRPSHDAGDRLRFALGIADDEIAPVEDPFDAVERRHPLTVVREAHDDPTPAEPSDVEGVQRLVPLEQDVVGDVDDVADGPHPRLHEALAQPCR